MLNFVKESIRHGGSLKRIRGDVFENKGVGNPSIERLGDEIYVSYRVCDYTFLSERYSMCTLKTIWYPNITEFDVRFGSENVIGVLDKDTLDVRGQRRFLENKCRGEYTYSGYEDTRLMEWDGKLYSSNSYPKTGNGKADTPIAINLLDGDFSSSREVFCKISDIEKNWMPVEGETMTYLYSTGNPLVVIHVGDGGNLSVVRRNDDIKFETFLKGSTQVRCYRDHYVVMVHYNTAVKYGESSVYKYIHMFLVYDKDWNFVGKSEPFEFLGFSIEFSCGLLIHDGFVYVTFSVYDNVSFVLKTPVEYFDYVIGFGNKPFVKKEPDASGDGFLGLWQTDECFYGLCEDLADEKNMNGAFSVWTNIGAFSGNKTLARESYINALCILKDCDVGIERNQTSVYATQDRIINQINNLNKEII